MLRKMLTLVALVVVAVAFGVGSASAANGHTNGNAGHAQFGDGFSDGRLGG
jgi:hypothetical protein